MYEQAAEKMGENAAKDMLQSTLYFRCPGGRQLLTRCQRPNRQDARVGPEERRPDLDGVEQVDWWGYSEPVGQEGRLSYLPWIGCARLAILGFGNIEKASRHESTSTCVG